MSSLLTQPLIGLDGVMSMQALLERDQAIVDSAGGKPARDWQPLATVQCFLWFGNGAAATRIGETRPRPESTVDLTTGGIVMPAATDVTARDRISQVLDENGNEIAGIMEILAVAPFQGMTELSVRKLS